MDCGRGKGVPTKSQSTVTRHGSFFCYKFRARWTCVRRLERSPSLCVIEAFIQEVVLTLHAASLAARTAGCDHPRITRLSKPFAGPSTLLKPLHSLPPCTIPSLPSEKQPAEYHASNVKPVTTALYRRRTPLPPTPTPTEPLAKGERWAGKRVRGVLFPYIRSSSTRHLPPARRRVLTRLSGTSAQGARLGGLFRYLSR